MSRAHADRTQSASEFPTELSATWKYGAWHARFGDQGDLEAATIAEINAIIADRTLAGVKPPVIRYVVAREVMTHIDKAERHALDHQYQAALSERIRAALMLQSKRMTSEDIAVVLGISLNDALHLIS